MENVSLEDLFIAAAENLSGGILKKLETALQSVEDVNVTEVVDSIDFLLDSWEDELSEDQADFIFSLAESGYKGNSIYRKQLAAAVKAKLPPYQAKTGFLRALGLRDKDTAPTEVLKRYHNLSGLKIGVFAYMKTSKRWGKMTNIDSFTGNAAITSIPEHGSFSTPLTTLLSDSVIFESSPETIKLTNTGKAVISSPEFRHIAMARAVTPLTDATLKKLAQMILVSESMSTDKFEQWWESAAASTKVSGQRHPSQARSWQELNTLLISSGEGAVLFDQDELVQLRSFFVKRRPPTNVKDLKMVFETFGLLNAMVDDSAMADLCEPLIGKLQFWPEDALACSLDELEVWGLVNVKYMEGVSAMMAAALDPEYMAEYAIKLPLKALNSFCIQVEDELLTAVIRCSRTCSCDILIWIWRNRKGHSVELLDEVNIEHVIRSLSVGNLPKAWGAAERELRKLLIDNAEFHKHLIYEADDNPSLLMMALQNAIFLNSGERQSLLVKLSRVSDRLRDALEGGGAEKLLGDELSSGDEGIIIPSVTSMRSHRLMAEELADLLSVQIPENREALKIARAHGDFRENAEYDAAKERRNFLGSRRAELTRDLMEIHPLLLNDVKLEGQAVVGSQVTIRRDSGGEVAYMLLGVWDGDPDRNWLSCRTKLGSALYGLSVTNQFELPEGGAAEITNIEPLPEDIISMLDEEV
jgi:transcription elongation GreA/GreB family factor